MNPARVYVIVTIAAFLVVAGLILFYRRRKEGERLSPLAGVAFGFIVASTFMRDNLAVGYILVAAALLAAAAEVVLRSRRAK